MDPLSSMSNAEIIKSINEKENAVRESLEKASEGDAKAYSLFIKKHLDEARELFKDSDDKLRFGNLKIKYGIVDKLVKSYNNKIPIQQAEKDSPLSNAPVGTRRWAIRKTQQ